MVQTLQWDQVEKMYFEIVFDLSIHHVGEFEPCQTQFNIFNFFLSPSWRLDPQNSFFFSIVVILSSLVKPIRPHYKTNYKYLRE